MTDASGSTGYLYNERDWLTNKTVTWNLPAAGSYTASLGYGYDAEGNLTSTRSSHPGGVDTTYTHDPLNRVQTAADPQLGGTLYHYDPVGNLTGYDYPNGLATTNQFDSLNRITNKVASRLGVPLAAHQYALANTGHRVAAFEALAISNTVRSISRVYTYDALYRLTREDIAATGVPELPPAAAVGYALDPVGNRLTRSSTLAAVPSSSSAYDPNDRLTTDAYDANGNTLISPGFAQTASDTYDFEDRLLTRHSSLVTIHSFYDGDGNRVRKTVNGVNTLYLVDDLNPTGYAQVLEELTHTGGTPGVVRTYLYGLDLIAQDQLLDDGNGGFAWAPSFYGTDAHGNTRFLTDTDGTVTDAYDYDAFGILIAQTGNTPNLYLYTGEQFDPDLGLYVLRARYLNQAAGRFWTRDTFEGPLDRQAASHDYAYSESEPVNRVDPSGLFSLTELKTSIAARETVGRSYQVTVNIKGRRKMVKTLSCEIGVAYAKRSIASDSIEGHHPIPRNLGGDPAKQALIFLPANTHRTFHWILNVVLKGEPEFAGRGNWTSSAAWDRVSSTPAGRRALYTAIRQASKLVDEFCDLKKPRSLTSYVERHRTQFVGGQW